MSSLDTAWQAALAAEQQAAFGYGLLGPHLRSADDIALAHDHAAAHEALRDGTAAALAAAGRTPGDPPADYPGLYPVADATAARRLAARLESDTAAAWRYLYAVAASARDEPRVQMPALRRTAQSALTGAAVRAVRWRGTPVPFPGV